MAENVGLKITLGGVTQVVSDIDKLRGSIEGAKKTLGGLEEGSEAFQQLSQEIDIATIALNAFEETAGQMNAPQKMGILQQAGKLVSSSFQAANNTLKQFGIDTEKIGQSASRAFQMMRKPLDMVSESLENTGQKLSQIPGPIGQVAQGITGLGQAMKILLANPIIAFLAAIVGALTLLYKAFTSTNDGADRMEQIFSGLGAIVDVLRDRLLQFTGALGKIFSGEILSGLKDLRDSFSGVGEEMTKEYQAAVQLTDQLQKLEDQERNLLRTRAEVNVQIAKAKELLTDESASLQERQKALDEVRKAEEGIAKQEQELAQARYDAIKAQNALSDTSDEALDKETQAYVELQGTIEKTASITRGFNKLQKRLNSEAAAEEKRRAEERKQQLKEQQELVIKTIDIEIQQYEKLKSVLSETVPEPEVLKQLRELLGKQQELIKQFEPMTTFDEMFSDTFTNIIPPVDQAAESIDEFGQSFLQTRKSLFETLPAIPSEFKKVTTSIREEFSQMLQLGTITKPAFDALDQILTNYENVNESINKMKLDVDGGVFDPKVYFDLVKNLKIARGEIQKEVKIVDGVIVGTRDVAKTSLEESARDLENYNKMVLKSIQEYFKTDSEFRSLSDEDKLKKAQEYFDKFISTVKTNSDAAIKEEQRIIDFFDSSFEVQKERQSNFFSSQLGFYKQNSDKLIDQLTSQFDLFSQDIEVAFDERIKRLIGNRQLTEEENEMVLQLYKDFYTKLNKLREENDKGEKTGFEKTMEFVKNLQTAIQEFQGVLNSLSQLQADFYTTQFKELELENQKVQDSIVGNTEESQKKRLEAEKIYQEKVKQLQKEQTIAGLKLDLAQAVANAAQAITKTFAAFGGTPAAFISSAIIAGINTVQVGLIQQQLSQAQSMQRGGRIKGQGGLVVGPSHEMGGVKFQGGGIELEGGETVINRLSAVRYNDLLNSINVNGGGRPLVQNNFDDSRIVEAIARQRSEPIRAYVLESEITNKQGINRRLEQLSSL